MANRWLRNIVDGTIYEWNEILAENKRCVEVTEEEAFPELFIPEQQQGREAKLDLTTKNLPPEPPTTWAQAEQEAEASKIPHPRALKK